MHNGSGRLAPLGALAMLIAIPPLGAQAAAPTLAALDTTSTPSACATAAWTYVAAFDKAHTTPGQMPTAAQQAAQHAAQREAFTQCLARFNRADLDGSQLPAVAELAVYADDDTVARALLTRRLADSTLSARDRARVLRTVVELPVRQYGREFERRADAAAGPMPVALQEQLARDLAPLQALGPAGAVEMLSALTTVAAYASDSLIHAEVPTVAPWAATVLRTDTARASRQAAVGGVDAWVAALARMGDAKGGVALVQGVRTQLADAKVPLDSASEARLVDVATQVGMVGRPAPALTAHAWLMPTEAHGIPLERAGSAAHGARRYTYAVRGAVTVIMFSSPECGACRMAYPTLEALVGAYGGRGVRFLIWTPTLGSFNDKPLTLSEELAHDRQYYFGHYGLTMPVAVQRVAAGEAWHRGWPSYHIGGIPDFVVVDAAGIVRYRSEGPINVRQTLSAALDRVLASGPRGPGSSTPPSG